LGEKREEKKESHRQLTAQLPSTRVILGKRECGGTSNNMVQGQVLPPGGVTRAT